MIIYLWTDYSSWPAGDNSRAATDNKFIEIINWIYELWYIFKSLITKKMFKWWFRKRNEHLWTFEIGCCENSAKESSCAERICQESCPAGSHVAAETGTPQYHPSVRDNGNRE